RLDVGCHRTGLAAPLSEGALQSVVGGSRSSVAKRRRSDGGLRHMPAIGSPTEAIRAVIVSSVNASGSTVATSSQRSGAETRASAVGRTEYADAIVRSRAFCP